jgi:dihydroneopterin triphosphate diphosphatase
MPYKIPRSVLVVIHTPELEVLLIERADHPGYWQSVTGSLEREDEPLEETAAREVMEETGIDASRHRLTDWRYQNAYDIYPQWLWRYAPGVTRNLEHVFGLEVADRVPVVLAPREHLAHRWLPWRDAAAACFSPSNAAAILKLPEKLAARG